MWTVMDSPIGQLRIVAHGRRDHRDRVHAVPATPTAGPRGERDDDNAVLAEAVRQLTRLLRP